MATSRRDRGWHGGSSAGGAPVTHGGWAGGGGAATRHSLVSERESLLSDESVCGCLSVLGPQASLCFRFFLQSLFICLADSAINQCSLAFPKQPVRRGGEHSPRSPGTHRPDGRPAPLTSPRAGAGDPRGQVEKGRAPHTDGLPGCPLPCRSHSDEGTPLLPEAGVCTWARRARGPCTTQWPSLASASGGKGGCPWCCRSSPKLPPWTREPIYRVGILRGG